MARKSRGYTRPRPPRPSRRRAAAAPSCQWSRPPAHRRWRLLVGGWPDAEKISSLLTELGAKKSERDEKINDTYKDLMDTPESATAAAEAKARRDFKIQDKNYIAELTATNKKISENYEKAEKIHKKIAATKLRIEEVEDAKDDETTIEDETGQKTGEITDPNDPEKKKMVNLSCFGRRVIRALLCNMLSRSFADACRIPR
eukprot:COSAG04_NODE_773_length_10423_cov_33.575165_5_plen_201_part_00